MDGVVTFDDVKDLKRILTNINEDFYNDKKDVIEENYEKAKQFHSKNDVVPRLTKTILADIKENTILHT